jgi:hypothetical protein
VHHIADRAAFTDARELIEHFGEAAADEAAARARKSRELGNIIHFCRWRQAGRIVLLLSEEQVSGTVH